MATTRRAHAARRKTARPRQRLIVTVTAPDGAVLSTRGLAVWLCRAAPQTARGEVTVALVSDARMGTLNRAYRGKDYATDVLSFPASASSEAPVPADAHAAYLGDIVIATGVAQRQAEQVGHPVSVELKVLALHGLLHLLGYDHETDTGDMARVESMLRKKAGLAEGLIARRLR
jgi:probable rRNA maturation factor